MTRDAEAHLGAGLGGGVGEQRIDDGAADAHGGVDAVDRRRACPRGRRRRSRSGPATRTARRWRAPGRGGPTRASRAMPAGWMVWPESTSLGNVARSTTSTRRPAAGQQHGGGGAGAAAPDDDGVVHLGSSESWTRGIVRERRPPASAAAYANSAASATYARARRSRATSARPRRVAPVFWSSRSTCLSTVRGEMNSRSATSRLVAPPATSTSTSTSRAVMPRPASDGGTASTVAARVRRGTGAPRSRSARRHRPARASRPIALEGRQRRAQPGRRARPSRRGGRPGRRAGGRAAGGTRRRAGEARRRRRANRAAAAAASPAAPAATASAARSVRRLTGVSNGRRGDLGPGRVAVVVEQGAHQRPQARERQRRRRPARGSRPCRGRSRAAAASRSPATRWKIGDDVAPDAGLDVVRVLAGRPGRGERLVHRGPVAAPGVDHAPGRRRLIASVDSRQRRRRLRRTARAAASASSISPRSSWTAASWRSTTATVARAPRATASRRAASSRPRSRLSYMSIVPSSCSARTRQSASPCGGGDVVAPRWKAASAAAEVAAPLGPTEHLERLALHLRLVRWRGRRRARPLAVGRSATSTSSRPSPPGPPARRPGRRGRRRSERGRRPLRRASSASSHRPAARSAAPRRRWTSAWPCGSVRLAEQPLAERGGRVGLAGEHADAGAGRSSTSSPARRSQLAGAGGEQVRRRPARRSRAPRAAACRRSARGPFGLAGPRRPARRRAGGARRRAARRRRAGRARRGRGAASTSSSAGAVAAEHGVAVEGVAEPEAGRLDLDQLRPHGLAQQLGGVVVGEPGGAGGDRPVEDAPEQRGGDEQAAGAGAAALRGAAPPTRRPTRGRRRRPFPPGADRRSRPAPRRGTGRPRCGRRGRRSTSAGSSPSARQERATSSIVVGAERAEAQLASRARRSTSDGDEVGAVAGLAVAQRERRAAPAVPSTLSARYSTTASVSGSAHCRSSTTSVAVRRPAERREQAEDRLAQHEGDSGAGAAGAPTPGTSERERRHERRQVVGRSQPAPGAAEQRLADRAQRRRPGRRRWPGRRGRCRPAPTAHAPSSRTSRLLPMPAGPRTIHVAPPACHASRKHRRSRVSRPTRTWARRCRRRADVLHGVRLARLAPSAATGGPVADRPLPDEALGTRRRIARGPHPTG